MIATTILGEIVRRVTRDGVFLAVYTGLWTATAIVLVVALRARSSARRSPRQ